MSKIFKKINFRNMSKVSIFYAVLFAGLFVTMFVLFFVGPEHKIIINSDADFEKYDFSGNGTAGDPYIIEYFTPDVNVDVGISISDTTKYFAIQHCTIKSTDLGIRINNVANRTGIIFNNTFVDNNNAIRISNCDGIMIYRNNITYSIDYGIILMNTTENSIICKNNFIENNYLGVSQGYDDRSGNFWYDPVSHIGNYWSDWQSGNYSIAGSANAFDIYPQSTKVF